MKQQIEEQSKRTTKTLVLDTSVLIHDPQCLTKFKNNDVCICSESLQELDKLKTEPSERGSAAREVQRRMLKLFGDGSMTAGVRTAGGGRLFVSVNRYLVEGVSTPGIKKLLAAVGDLKSMDNKILANAIFVAEGAPPPVIVVTKDLNMRLKAGSVGMEVQDYRNDRVEPESENWHPKVRISATDMQRFASTGDIALPRGRVKDLFVNDYVVLDDGKTMPARYLGSGRFIRLHGGDGISVPDGAHVRALNIGQQFMLDAILDPSVTLLTVSGPAGTGKTLLSVAAGLSMMAARQYHGMSITRPVVSMGDGIGFLPGSLQEKMAPWLQPYFDAITFLLSRREGKNGKPQSDRKVRREQEKQRGGSGTAPLHTRKPYEKLVEAGLLEIEALCYIRGRSIPNRLFILDEAQQLTPLEAKTVVTRISKGSKLVLLGDTAQIDNPYVDALSNGLVYTRNKLRGQEMTAHITLSKCERSPLAEKAAELM